MNTTGFLHNIWDRVEAVGQIVEKESHQVDHIIFPSDTMAQEFVEVAHRDDLWSNPLKCDLQQDNNRVYILR